MFLVSTQFVRKNRFVHQFFLQLLTTGSIISCHPGPEPNSGRKNVSAIVTMRGGNSRISRAMTKAGRLNRRRWPFVTFHVTNVVNIPLMGRRTG
jgi:hypothetical protein